MTVVTIFIQTVRQVGKYGSYRWGLRRIQRKWSDSKTSTHLSGGDVGGTEVRFWGNDGESQECSKRKGETVDIRF